MTNRLSLLIFYCSVFVLIGLALSACGGGGPVTAGTIDVTVECTVANACSINNSGTITVTLPGAAASAPAAAASTPAATPPAPPASSPTPSPAVPLAVPQIDTLPYVTVCDGCLKWSVTGTQYAVVFRDTGFGQVAMIVSCMLKDCTPGMYVWNVVTVFDQDVDLELMALTDKSNAGLTAYAKNTIYPPLAAWFFANIGNLTNGFKVSATSTLPVPESGDAFARVTAIFAEHAHIGADQSVNWNP